MVADKVSNYNIITTEVLNPRWVFDRSMKTNLNRADIMIRLLAIDAFYHKNDFGFILYNEMQRTRCHLNNKVPPNYAEHQEDFIKLINSMENGYDYQYPIILNKNKELLDGSHRLSLCLYHNIQQLPVIICDNETSIDYSLDWFINNGLQHFKKYILDKYKEVVQTCQNRQ